MFVITGEDVQSNQVNFSVAVLPSLGGGHLHDLGGSVLQEKYVKSLQEIINFHEIRTVFTKLLANKNFHLICVFKFNL